jgi:hypothetical protein
VHEINRFFLIEDLRSNQFVVRIFDLNEKTEETTIKPEQSEESAALISPEAEEKRMLAPTFEYILEKTNKYFQIDSSYIKIQ